MSAELDKAIDVIAGHVTSIDDNGSPVLSHIHDTQSIEYRAVWDNVVIARRHGLSNDEVTERVCEAYAKRVQP